MVHRVVTVTFLKEVHHIYYPRRYDFNEHLNYTAYEAFLVTLLEAVVFIISCKGIEDP